MGGAGFVSRRHDKGGPVKRILSAAFPLCSDLVSCKAAATGSLPEMFSAQNVRAQRVPSLAWIPASQSALRASHVCQPNLSEIVPAPPVQESIVCDRTIVLAIHRAIHTRPLPTSVSLPGGDDPALVAKVKSYDGGCVALSVDTGNWVRAGRGGGPIARRVGSRRWRFKHPGGYGDCQVSRPKPHQGLRVGTQVPRRSRGHLHQPSPHGRLGAKLHCHRVHRLP